MHRSVTRVRRVGTVVAALLTLLGAPTLAGASVDAGTSPAQESVNSGNWGVVPTTSTVSPPPPGSLTLSWTLAKRVTTGVRYFDAANDGSIALVGASYRVTLAGTANVAGATTVTLTACIGGSWNQASGACPATAVQIGTWTSKSNSPVASTAAPATPGSRLNVQAQVAGASSNGGSLTAVVDVTAGSGSVSQLRPGQTTQN